ncbi:MAG: copper resistance protein [Paraburkholderia sp.]|jgi:methionine-rich copper-binding protein CopC|nr:copper resistance protein [Paraburkholderia sp.]
MKINTRNKLTGMAMAVTFGLLPALALAHGTLEQATPAANSVVDVTPATLKLTFNEALESAFSTIKVTDGNGTAVSKEKAKVDPSDPRVLTVPVPKLSSGSYAVHWTVMTHDGHKTKGDYKFTVK